MTAPDPLISRLAELDPAAGLEPDGRDAALLEGLLREIAAAPVQASRRSGRRIGVRLAAGFSVVAAVAITVIALGSLHHRTIANHHGRSGHANGNGGSGRAHQHGVTNRNAIEIQQSYDHAGDPRLIANLQISGTRTAEGWSVCDAHGAGCHRVKDSLGELTPGQTEPGTVFKATITADGRTYSARTGVWLGRVHALSSPTLTGAAKAGSVVIPNAARWGGGWSARPTPQLLGDGNGPANSDALTVEACRTRGGSHCVNLTPAGSHDGYSTGPVTVDRSLTGMYLFAFDQRLSWPVPNSPSVPNARSLPNARSVPNARPGHISPAEMPKLRVTATTVRSAPLGPIAGPPAPHVAIISRPQVSGGRVLFARVHCASPCRVRLEALGMIRDRMATVTVTGTELVGLASQGLTRGPVKVVVSIGNLPAVSGRIRLR